MHPQFQVILPAQGARWLCEYSGDEDSGVWVTAVETEDGLRPVNEVFSADVVEQMNAELPAALLALADDDGHDRPDTAAGEA